MMNKITIGAIGLLVIAQVVVIGILGNLSGRVAEISGSLGSRDITAYNVDTPSTGAWTAVDNVLTGELLVTSSTTLSGTGTSTFNVPISYAGFIEITDTGTCADATTTPVSILNPFAASSTAYLRLLEGQNGTTTFALLAGTSTTISPNRSDIQIRSDMTLFDTELATNTQFFLTGANNIGVSVATATAPLGIFLAPTDRFIITATGTSAANGAVDVEGLTNTTNTFSCEYRVQFSR